MIESKCKVTIDKSHQKVYQNETRTAKYSIKHSLDSESHCLIGNYLFTTFYIEIGFCFGDFKCVQWVKKNYIKFAHMFGYWASIWKFIEKFFRSIYQPQSQIYIKICISQNVKTQQANVRWTQNIFSPSKCALAVTHQCVATVTHQCVDFVFAFWVFTFFTEIPIFLFISSSQKWTIESFFESVRSAKCRN